MTKIEILLRAISVARQNYLEKVNQLTEQQAQWKPSPDVWNAVQITEHLFWAEQGGILSIWKALQAKSEGKVVWEGERIHAGKTMETIIEQTWKEKEEVPVVAAPRLGGPIAYWKAMLLSLEQVLTELEKELLEDDLATMTPPHPISGPFDIHQRLEFIRFHLERHLGQLLEIYQGII